MIARQLPQTSRRRHKGHHDRGAAAVEMALVLPLLLFLVMGIIDFGRAYSAQIQLSSAAREGVRLAALNPGGTLALQQADSTYGDVAIPARITNAAGGLPTFAASCSLAPTNTMSYVCITYCPTPPSASDTTTVVLKAKFNWITGISEMAKFFGPGVFPTPATIQITGVMRCAG